MAATIGAEPLAIEMADKGGPPQSCQISQSCAEKKGCFSGDAPGFPVTITAPGRCELVSNLTVDAETTAILVEANDVIVDLNGFSISGPAVCSGDPTSCVNTGRGSGVLADWAYSNIAVVNGTVRGMGSAGIALTNAARVEQVRAISNGGEGISGGNDSTVTHSFAMSNGMSGISLITRGKVAHCVANNNGGNGIGSAEWSCVEDNVAVDNGRSGIFAGCSATVSRNTASSNHEDGISVCGYMAVMGNTANENLWCGIRYGSADLIDNVTFGNTEADICDW
jgi:hypothetical protein